MNCGCKNLIIVEIPTTDLCLLKALIREQQNPAKISNFLLLTKSHTYHTDALPSKHIYRYYRFDEVGDSCAGQWVMVI